jgi:heat shock transcription factor
LSPIARASADLDTFLTDGRDILRKTWNLVSDPSTDHIVSWTADGRTFTVWNPDQMEKEQLPNTFKHSNFASFVRQLNNYGFRKCHSDRFEFGVEGFEQGKPELLTTLKRHDAPRNKKSGAAGAGGRNGKNNGASGSGARNDAVGDRSRANTNGSHGGYHPSAHARGGTPDHGAQSLELGAYGGVTSEVEQLKRDRLLLLKEVMRLREEQAATADEVRRLGARLQSTEQFQTTMLNFVDQVRESGGKLENLSFDGFAALDIPGLSTGTVPGAAPRKRRQMYLPPADPAPSRGGHGTHAVGSLGFGGSNPGSGGGGGYGGSSFPQHATGVSSTLADRFQEIEEDMEGPAADDALAHQMFGPLSPNPRAPIQLPDQAGWLDAFASGAGDGDDMQAAGALMDEVNASAIPNGVGVGAVDKPDAFVSSILERGPSLEKQLSLGFLDSMNSAEIGEMVRDMNIGNRHEQNPVQDEVAARFAALDPAAR